MREREYERKRNTESGERMIRERRHTHVDKDGNTKIASVESEAQTYTKTESV
jgi:hypothetical protein